jgi:hypothetical protein
MEINGITWHGLTLEPDQLGAMKKLCGEVFGLTPTVDQDGWTLYSMPNGTMLDLFEPGSEMVPAYGLNDGIVFGFRVDDIARTLSSKRRESSSCATFIASLR